MKRFIYKITHPFIRFYWKIFKPKTYGSRAIILHGIKVLLVKNINVQHWSLPGGKIDSGESPEECIFRELKEELSLSEIRTDYKLGEYISKKEGKTDIVYIFVINLFSPIFEKQWELEDARWFNLDELPEDISPAGLRRIKEYQAGKKDIFADW
jgi:8-oxo-dGTP pyrophosphatase MutT (NUDIX family)